MNGHSIHVDGELLGVITGLVPTPGSESFVRCEGGETLSGVIAFAHALKGESAPMRLEIVVDRDFIEHAVRLLWAPWRGHLTLIEIALCDGTGWAFKGRCRNYRLEALAMRPAEDARGLTHGELSRHVGVDLDLSVQGPPRELTPERVGALRRQGTAAHPIGVGAYGEHSG